MSSDSLITAVVRGIVPYAVLAGAGYIGYRVLKKNGVIDGIFKAPEVIVKTISETVENVNPVSEKNGGIKNAVDLIPGIPKGTGAAVETVIDTVNNLPGPWEVEEDPLPQGKKSWSEFAADLGKAPWQVTKEYIAYLSS